ncbi:type II toxin-antitoxin system RelE/ParE family toxin [Chamaesiphon sp. VAR_69_metabat_338]|uniref:type II toxin-antitoxin system RelE/ParE family toxin n=1 Tax=Chamaesiphon sp. VAR_69_metabat_338 TaxID=2964704 RepID=UPI00286E8C88|nr:type II toxin-antitoxin system RelE/ParE family toxin [Chamaesiphon sp. VAR_69_metabat_338]
MSVQILFAQIAKQDLRDIWRGLAEYSGLSVVDSTLANIESKFRVLVQFPSSGRSRSVSVGESRDELLVGLRSYPAGDFVIFYQILETTVEVVRVLHGRRDIDSIFDESESS